MHQFGLIIINIERRKKSSKPKEKRQLVLTNYLINTLEKFLELLLYGFSISNLHLFYNTPSPFRSIRIYQKRELLLEQRQSQQQEFERSLLVASHLLLGGLSFLVLQRVLFKHTEWRQQRSRVCCSRAINESKKQIDRSTFEVFLDRFCKYCH